MLKRTFQCLSKKYIFNNTFVKLKNRNLLTTIKLPYILNFTDKKEEEEKNKKDNEEKEEEENETKKIQYEKGLSYFKNMLILSFFGITILSTYNFDLYDKKNDYNIEKTTYTELINKIKKDKISEIKMITDFFTGNYINKVIITEKTGKKFSLPVLNMNNFLKSLETIQKREKRNPENYINISSTINPLGEYIRTKSLFAGIYLSLTYFLLFKEKKLLKTIFSSNKMSSVTRKIKSFQIEKIETDFSSIAGLSVPKLEIREFVEFLKDPAKFHKLGARMPRGVLLTGPPGTGKTMLAKACAREADICFFSISGSDFVEKYIGIGAANVRKLFEEARRNSPSIIFIDEIDAIGKKREMKFGNDEKKHTLNQLLVEMDGFGTEADVVIMAATNKAESLDKALTRPGRFDRHIALDLPDIDTRQEIFKIYLKRLELKDKAEEDVDKISRKFSVLTPGFSGAEIKNLCNEAAILAAREEMDFITEKHLEEATERIIGGLRQKSLLSETERKTVSIHECGHAIISWNLKNSDPLLKISLVARSKGKLGFSQYFKEDIKILTKSEIIDKIIFLLGGRAAEEIIFGKENISTGAEDDFTDIFEISKELISKFGMGKHFKYFGDGNDKLFGEELEWKIDQGIMEVVGECYDKALGILRENKDLLEELSTILLEKERIGFEDIGKVLGERKFEVRENFRDFLDGKF